MRELDLKVEGMTCEHCESTVARALGSVPGVESVEVSYEEGRATVVAVPGTEARQLEKALEPTAYRGRVESKRGLRGAVRVGSGKSAYDLVVLGGGSAGFAAALRGADLGARVALVNDGTIGGTCVNVGCVPSKTLIRAAEANHRRAHHGSPGIPATNGAPDWAAVRRAKDELVGSLRQSKYRDVLAAYDGITLFEQRGRVGPDGSVTLADGTVLGGGRLVVTTGSSPWAAPIAGLAEAGYLDSRSAMELDQLPASLIVIGGGFVGMELGQMFSRLGVEVTVLARRPVVLPREDHDLGRSLAGYLEAEGMTIRTDVTIERVERSGRYTVYFQDGGRPESVSADQLLVATGRRPNTRGFGLEEAGVTLGERGEIVVDELLRSTNPAIYAAGDVTGDPMYVYVAAYAGSLAAANALSVDSERYDLSAVPSVTFTDPAVATVGLTEEAARGRGIEAISSVLPLEYVARALAARDTRGFIKLVADARTRKLVGAHILAPEAGELISEPTLAIKFGLTIEDLTSTFHPYLTQSEGIKLAAQTFDRDVAKLSCCAA